MTDLPQIPIEIVRRPLRLDAETTLRPQQWSHAELTEVCREWTSEVETLLVKLALTRHHLLKLQQSLEGEAAETTATLAAQLSQMLEPYHIQVVDPSGSVWDRQWSSEFEVLAYHSDPSMTEIRVAHTQHPAVFRADRCIARGLVQLRGPGQQDAT